MAPKHHTLLAVPNISEGRDAATIAAIGEAFAGAGARLLDVHADPDHHRSVYTLACGPAALAQALLAGVSLATQRVSIADGRGEHPHVGAVDVAPIVYLSESGRGAACAAALLLGDLLGERLGLPVLLYGELAGGRTRAELRRGGVVALSQRIAEGKLRPDFGPRRLHPTAGATLVAARPPLVAFNLELAPPAGLAEARAIAALVREGGEHGLPGLRAIGIPLRHQVAGRPPSRQVAGRPPRQQVAGRPPSQQEIGQVSMNVEDPFRLPLRTVVAAVSQQAKALGARIAAAELVGLAPSAALEGFPKDLPLRGFEPQRHLLENALRAAGLQSAL